ncbi:ABC transporter substrate-binding protein [Nocardia higoensis]|uniref:ABC transporter substrate-binding protein n=1 Tax=Nocardia higoensis TaxID=228599 RepID=A0ABS0D3I5_9NOCA|nr:ABC transporter substrate-binding protein [Nocardia higoensis]MBF6353031.1 ABC transporter substrate-binding protein [Nocardia higoensis]
MTNTVHRAGRAALLAGLAACLALTACNSTGNSADNAGSGGFVVNAEDCQDPEAAAAPIEGAITVGFSAPLSGPVAGPAELAGGGYKARIAAQNARGGIDGHQIEVVYRDDSFQPDKAKANATEFLQRTKVDILNTFGAGALGAMADDQNAACVPLLYPSSSAPQFQDMQTYPWTVQFLPSAAKETRFLVQYIQQKVPGARVGIAENSTASGVQQSAAFQASAKEAGLDIVLVTPDTDPNAAATALKEAGADVVYHAGVVGSCGVFDTARDRIGYKPELVVKASNCVNTPEYLTAGAAADGVVIPRYLKDPGDPAMVADPGVQTYLADMTGVADPNNAVTISGWLQADLMINTLQQAATSEQGLTRISIIEAARNQTYSSPMLTDGIEWVSTPDHPAGVNGFEPIAWSAAERRFLPAGPVVAIQ